MKRYRVNIVRLCLFGFLLLLSEIIYSQIPKPKIDKKDRLVTYSETFSSELNREQLYINIKTWMFVHMNIQDSIFEIKSSEVSRIIGKKTLETNNRSGKIDLSIQIDYKDYEFRYTVKILDSHLKKNKINVTKSANSDSDLHHYPQYDIKQWEIISTNMYYFLNSLKENIGFKDDFW